MLEVGIGIGFFMELATEKGWDIEGVEPSLAACQYVGEALKLQVHHGTLEVLHLPQKHFDVIALRHVLEHIQDPKAFLRELHRLVKDDGIICLVVPNFGGLHSRVEKARWYHLSLPYHVAHYTKSTLTALLTACDFEIIQLLTTDLSCSSYCIGLFNIVLSVFKQQPRNMYMNPRELDSTLDFPHWLVSKEAILNNVMARLGLGEEITVIVKKRAEL
jgi:SAM-dependent methyltransferase